MISIGIIVIGFLCVLGLLLLGLHVGTVMALTALAGVLYGFGPALLNSMGNLMWGQMNSFVLTAIPLYILMGEILVNSRIAERMYRALTDWVQWLPGRLLHSNIASSTMFSAISGSSVATAATISTVAFPTFRAHGYSERWVAGSIASGATLGILIPPSINLIIYGAITDTSIGALFIAGIIPGLLLASFFVIVIAVAATIWPSIAGDGSGSEPDLSGRWKRLIDLIGPVVIFALIIGSIYGGWATPTEAAAVGVVASLMLAAYYRKLTFAMLNDSLLTTIRITAIILFVLMGAYFLNFAMGVLGIPDQVASVISSMDVSPTVFVLCLVLLYLVLGCFLDALAMMITTIPVLFPVVVAVGFDPVWFGVFIVIMCELALLTPPVGMNLYIVQGVRNRGQITDVIMGVLPFFISILSLVALITVFPQIVTWLPETLK
ncbi:TRAP transporter large permease [Sedimentitalea sp. JM2-8]|uniref:TRAP transporter large permease protein n=1 Tax=Sedimentitalea xiamensis TaxID=3050037 RepID=A0ABT7FIP0_9RHOB|nr:TRAP transporter large permease [Sedimentitalea xiamensis]MDK3074993.1 TRAP transporter large permease [Sedimentitalea xiamensis]